MGGASEIHSPACVQWPRALEYAAPCSLGKPLLTNPKDQPSQPGPREFVTDLDLGGGGPRGTWSIPLDFFQVRKLKLREIGDLPKVKDV